MNLKYPCNACKQYFPRSELKSYVANAFKNDYDEGTFRFVCIDCLSNGRYKEITNPKKGLFKKSVKGFLNFLKNERTRFKDKKTEKQNEVKEVEK